MAICSGVDFSVRNGLPGIAFISMNVTTMMRSKMSMEPMIRFRIYVPMDPPFRFPINKTADARAILFTIYAEILKEYSIEATQSQLKIRLDAGRNRCFSPSLRRYIMKTYSLFFFSADALYGLG